MITNYLDIPSPFGLVKPSEHWLRTLAAFDPDLVLFPSQKQPGVYRLGRIARLTGGITARVFQKVGSLVHPDTKIMFERRLVSVTTVPHAAVAAPCELLCQQLRLRDTWRYPQEDGAAKALEAMEADERTRSAQSWKEESRARHRASRISFLHRTGARVSLVTPRRHMADAASPTTPTATAAASSQEGS